MENSVRPKKNNKQTITKRDKNVVAVALCRVVHRVASLEPHLARHVAKAREAKRLSVWAPRQRVGVAPLKLLQLLPLKIVERGLLVIK